MAKLIRIYESKLIPISVSFFISEGINNNTLKFISSDSDSLTLSMEIFNPDDMGGDFYKLRGKALSLVKDASKLGRAGKMLDRLEEHLRSEAILP